jgi:hypothetical protein
MRTMRIPPFRHAIEIPDDDDFIRNRLSQRVVMWPDQAIPLVGYMCHPNHPKARASLVRTLRTWPLSSEGVPRVPPRLHRIQHEWLRVADVFHTYCDLIEGLHQKRRGGGSIGKAITLVAAKAKSGGTGAASLWKQWTTYKDVAHLVTPAGLICVIARRMNRQRPFGQFGLDGTQILPFNMALMIPDLVLAVALDLEPRGLDFLPHARTEPTFNAATLWRVPPNINVVPCRAPIRRISTKDTVILNSRRAGNRGKGKARKTTPVSAEEAPARSNSR